MAPPDCGGGCALWWALVVAARAVGRWAIGAVLLCATPGPLGPVDGGRGGCWWCPPIAVAVARHRGRWWVVTRERWEWGDRRRALACNAWAFRPSGQRRGMGVTGGPRSSLSSRRPVVVAVGGSQPGRSTSSVSRASAQRQGLSTRWTVVWGGALGAVRLPLPSSWCTVVAFGGSRPGRSMVSASHASVQRGVFPGRRELARGGRVPLRRSGRRHTFVPLRRRWVVCRRLRRAAVARVSATLGPWGLLAMWRWVASVPSFALGVAVRCCGGPGVVACTGCKTCAMRLGATLGAWLCRQDDGGGGACSWALVVVGGACPVTALVEVVGCGALPRRRRRRLLYARNIEISFFTCRSIIASIASGSAHLSFNLLSISDQI